MEDIQASIDDAKLALEILKTLHGATVSRWMNRRDQEWKLSYAFWTALAGFAAAILFGKDVNLPAPSLWMVGLWICFAIALHAFYLHQMVRRLLRDADTQMDLEKAITRLSPHVSESHVWSASAGVHRYYGFIAQMGITLLLSCAVLWITANHRSA